MKKSYFFVIFIFLFLSLAAAAETGEELFLAGMAAYEKNDFATAALKLDDFLVQFPKSKYRPTALLRRAELEKDFDRAAAMYEEVVSGYSGTDQEAEAVFSLGKLHYAKGDYKKSAEYFNTILSRFGLSNWAEEAYYYLLLSENNMKNYDEAGRLYSAYIRNTNFNIFRLRVTQVYANSLFLQEHYEAAAGAFKAIIEQHADREKYIYLPGIYYKLAQCYKAMGREAAAEKYLTELKAAFPGSKEAKAEVVAAVLKAAPVQKAGLKPEDSRGTKSFYTIQVGAYKNEKFAVIAYNKLKEKKYEVYMSKSGKFIRLQVGKFKTKPEADAFAEKLAKKEKLNNYLVKLGREE